MEQATTNLASSSLDGGEKKSAGKKYSAYYLLALGVSVTLPGQFLYWSVGVQYGFWIFFGAFLVVSSAYACLVMSLAEMYGCFPFSGGSYGLCRVTVGPLTGFIVGTADRVDLLSSMARLVYIIGVILNGSFSVDRKWNYIAWAVLCLFGAYFSILPPMKMWTRARYAAILAVLLLPAFILCTLPHLHINPSLYYFDGSCDTRCQFSNFLKAMPYGTMFYSGIHVVKFAIQDIEEPRKNLPRVNVGLFWFLFAVAIALQFIVISHAPFTFSEHTRTLAFLYTWSNATGMKSNYMALLFVPVLAAVARSFSYAAIKQMVSMMNSGLMITGDFQKLCNMTAQQVVTIVAALACYMIVALTNLGFRDTYFKLYEISLMSFVVAQLGNLYSFIVFRREYGHVKRSYVSPVGIPGAILAGCVSIFIFVGMLIDGRQGGIMFLCWLITMVVPVILYFLKTHKTQVFSQEEQAVLFVAHVLKANAQRKKRIASGKHRAPSMFTPNSAKVYAMSSEISRDEDLVNRSVSSEMVSGPASVRMSQRGKLNLSLSARGVSDLTITTSLPPSSDNLIAPGTTSNTGDDIEMVHEYKLDTISEERNHLGSPHAFVSPMITPKSAPSPTAVTLSIKNFQTPLTVHLRMSVSDLQKYTINEEFDYDAFIDDAFFVGDDNSSIISANIQAQNR